MRHARRFLGIAVVSVASFANAQTPAALTLTRLQCGTNTAPTDVGQRFSDTYAFTGFKVQLTASCYLVRHGDDYLVGTPAILWATHRRRRSSPSSICSES
jgi:hypothetical protein